MYKIIGDAGTVWYYDALTNRVYDGNRSPINLLALQTAQFFTSPDALRSRYESRLGGYNALKPEDRVYHYSEDVTDLVAHFGFACNYKCLYCCQRIIPSTPQAIDIKDFCRRLRASDINFSALRTIQLWGGEPLVYWKAVKEFVCYVRENIPEFTGHFHLTTNAELLDKAKCEFFLEHKVQLQVSHDGVNQTLTRHATDWLDDPDKRELMRWFLTEQRGGDINVTYAPLGNPNLIDTLDYFYDRLGNPFVCLRAPLRCDATNAYLMADYSPEKVEIAKQSFYKILMQDIPDDYVFMCSTTYSRLQYLGRNIVLGVSPLNIEYNCPSKQRKALHFDVRGNYIPCHGSSVDMGHGVGTIDNVKECYDIGFTSVANREFCRDCLYTQICQGPCGMANDLNTLIHCKSMRWAYETWLAAIWTWLFNEKPISIEKDQIGKVQIEKDQ